MKINEATPLPEKPWSDVYGRGLFPESQPYSGACMNRPNLMHGDREHRPM